MTTTKIRAFPASNVKDVDSFLNNAYIKYIDLKVIQGKQLTDTSLLLVYEIDDLNLVTMIKRVWNTYSITSSTISNLRVDFSSLTNYLHTNTSI